jgi:hypothetical protein
MLVVYIITDTQHQNQQISDRNNTTQLLLKYSKFKNQIEEVFLYLGSEFKRTRVCGCIDSGGHCFFGVSVIAYITSYVMLLVFNICNAVGVFVRRLLLLV